MYLPTRKVEELFEGEPKLIGILVELLFKKQYF